MISSKGNLVGKINGKQILNGQLSNATVKVSPELEDIEITPSEVEQNFKSTKYGYDNVKVKAIASDTLNIVPSEEEQEYVGLYGVVNVDKIPNEYTKTEGTLDITKNGEYDVKTYEKANVNIEGKEEDLTNELTVQDNLITEQETTIEDIIEALQGKSSGGSGTIDLLPYVSTLGFTADFQEIREDVVLHLERATGLGNMFDLKVINAPKMTVYISNKCTTLYRAFGRQGGDLEVLEIIGDTSKITTFAQMCQARNNLKQVICEFDFFLLLF